MKYFNVGKLTVLSVFLLLAGCNQKPVRQATPVERDSDTVAVQSVEEKDSTLFGVAGDFGMSTFCLITDKGDTILVTRDSESGKDGIIYGDAQPGDRYSMITCDHGEALSSAINLTQLERFTKDYKINNGHLILSPASTPDTVQIKFLSDDSLVVVSPVRGIHKFSAVKHRRSHSNDKAESTMN